MCDKNTISKTEKIQNNFRAGYLLDASGERAIFSSRLLISRQRWAGNIYDDRSFCLYHYYMFLGKICQLGLKIYENQVLNMVGTNDKI